MVYVTKQYPSPRTYDTVIGKVMGYLAELDFYLERDQACVQIYALCSAINWFPLSYIIEFLVNIQKWMYSSSYQNVYNQGADKGNEINKQILGWMDGLKSDYLSKISDAKASLNAMISDLSAKLSSLKISVTDFESKINTTIADFNAKVNDAIKKVNDALTRIDALTKQAQTKYAEFEKSLTTFKTKTDTIMKDLQALADRVKTLEEQGGVRAKEYKASIIEEIKEMLGI